MDAGSNPYQHAELAGIYAGFGYEGTYYLIARDFPGMVEGYVTGNSALDFACGAGRSTRLLKQLGFETVGVDVSAEMLSHAVRRDPDGTYILARDGELNELDGRVFDLVLSAFPFSSTSQRNGIESILKTLNRKLAPNGRLFVIEPTPGFYRNEWLSFTADFPENASAKSGDSVRAAFRNSMDKPVVDFMWADDDYRTAFEHAALQVLEVRRPLGRADDPYHWISEKMIAPWVIYVLAQGRRVIDGTPETIRDVSRL